MGRAGGHVLKGDITNNGRVVIPGKENAGTMENA